MKEYVKHIQKPTIRTQGIGMSYCGERTEGIFAFVDIEHAYITRKQEHRFLVCPACIKEITKTLKS